MQVQDFKVLQMMTEPVIYFVLANDSQPGTPPHRQGPRLAYQGYRKAEAEYYFNTYKALGHEVVLHVSKMEWAYGAAQIEAEAKAKAEGR